MKSKILNWLAIILILEVGIVHYFTAQHEFEEAAILGYLFMANFLVALVASYGIYRRKKWGWIFGFIIAAGLLVGYIWSRMSGLSGLEAEAWLIPSGVLAVAVECLFLLVMLARPWKIADKTDGNLSLSLIQHLLPLSIMVGMVLITGYVNLSLIGSGDAHHEVASVKQLSRMLPLSQDEFEQKYGMRVTQVAISALDSIVDVRVKVLDPEKAHPLLEDHPALFVDGQSVVLAPHWHSHAKLKPGQIFVMFFPTQNKTVRQGSKISLVFDDLRVEPVTTK